MPLDLWVSKMLPLVILLMGTTPAPDMVNLPLFTRFHTRQVVGLGISEPSSVEMTPGMHATSDAGVKNLANGRTSKVESIEDVFLRGLSFIKKGFIFHKYMYIYIIGLYLFNTLYIYLHVHSISIVLNNLWLASLRHRFRPQELHHPIPAKLLWRYQVLLWCSCTWAEEDGGFTVPPSLG